MSDQNKVVVLLSNDLMLSSSVSGYARAASITFQNPATMDGIVASAPDDPQILLLIDLEAPGLDIAALAASLPPSVRQQAVAYGPHVHTQRLALAEQAGIGTVMSRGQFSARVGQLISAWADV